jgi:hydroxyacylglutathione hydrolase
MLFLRFYDDDLAQASYLIGCQQHGIAIVIDPRRDIEAYLDEAAKQEMRIVAVTETHIHADYLSGARELAAATGAALHLSNLGGEDWQYGFAHEPLSGGSELKLGNITLRALHTPGHTPEHLSFLITDGASAAEPGYLLTGDFVFVGDLGRPDLLDESAGGKDTRVPMARQLFASLKATFWPLPDYVQVWPGHGAGSACGKALGAVPSSTVGYEKLVAWWASYVKSGNVDAFVTALLDGQPDAPSYFARMKRLNRDGPSLLGEREPLRRYAPEELAALLEAGEVRFVDTRPKDAYHRGTLPGALHLPEGKTFATWAAWLIDPERDPKPLVLLARDQPQAHALRDKLSRVGIDAVQGYSDSLDGLKLSSQPQASWREIETLDDATIVDVRAKSEYDAGHVPGAKQIHAGRLLEHLDNLPKDRPILLHCQSGNRSAAAASALRSAGFDNVYDIEGGYKAWLEQPQAHASTG